MTAVGPGSRFRKSYVIALAVDRYRAGIPALQNAVRDARAVVDVLATQHGFTPIIRFDERATAGSVRRLLDRLTPRLQATDRVLFYVAGHGVALSSAEGPEGYLLLHDADRADPATFLAMRQLRERIEAWPCRHLLAVLDCCFAGTFRWASSRDVQVAGRTVYRETFDRFCESPAWQVVTSAAQDQQALDVFGDRGSSEHSPFCAALLDGLAGAADLNHDGLVTATDLYSFIRDRVELATDASQLQTPGLFPLRRHERGEFVLAVPGRPLALPPAAPLSQALNPYRGLASYDEPSHALMFGRDELAARVATEVLARTLTVVVGPSGCGKSSLVNAGVLPRLRAQRPDLTIQGPVRPIDGIRDGVADRPLPDGPVVVVVDQLEDLYTQAIDATARAAFLDAVAAWTRLGERVHVIVTVRSDFEPQFQAGPLAAHWAAARLVVPPMSQDQLRRAIEGPAAVRELYFQPISIIDELINEVVQMPGALPLLSFTLSELYLHFFERHADDRAITEADVAAVGGVPQALTRRASSELDQLIALDPSYQATARKVFLRLVTREGGELARRRVPETELVFSDDPGDRRVDTLVGKLVDTRLLVSGSIDGARYIEPAHDALIHWDRLGRWLAASADTEVLRRAVATDAATWVRNARDPAFLWDTDPRLALLVAAARAPDPPFNIAETQFAARSARRRRQRHLTTSAVILGVIAALSAITVVAVRARDRAIAETARAEAAQRLEVARRAALLAETPGAGTAARIVALEAALPDVIAGRPLEREALVGLGAALASYRSIVLAGHTARALDGAWAPDGRSLATVSSDGALKRWDRASGRLLSSSECGVGELAGVTYSPDGTRLVAAGETGPVLWDPVGPRRIARLEGHKDVVWQTAFSPTGEVFATADGRGLVQLWRTRDGALVRALSEPHADRVAQAAFTGRGQVIVSRGEREAVVWDLATLQIVRRVTAHDNIRLVAAVPDWPRIATVDQDGISVWNLDSGEEWRLPPVSGVRAIRFAPRGDAFTATANDAVIRLYGAVFDASSAAQEQPILLANTTGVDDAMFSPDGAMIAARSGDGTTRVWNRRLGATLIHTLAGHRGQTMRAVFSPDCADLLTVGVDTTARIWRLDQDLALRDLARGDPSTETGSVADVQFARDGRTVATVHGDGNTRTWDARDGHALGTAPSSPPAGEATAVATTEDRATITGGADGALRRLDAQGELRATSIAVGVTRSAVLSPDGARLLTTGDGKDAYLWNAHTLALDATLHREGNIAAGAFSPDSQRIATVSLDGNVTLWDGHTGALVRATRPVMDEVRHVAFSRDGQLVLSGHDDGYVRVWSVPALELQRVIRGPQGGIKSIVVLPGDRIAVASGDFSVRVFDLRSGDQLLVLRGVDDVDQLAASPDGQRLVVRTSTSTRLYPLNEADLVALACQSVVGLAPAEVDEGERQLVERQCRAFVQRHPAPPHLVPACER